MWYSAAAKYTKRRSYQDFRRLEAGKLKLRATASFITGAKPLSDWDAFVAQIRSMGIDRCIALQQAALDR